MPSAVQRDALGAQTAQILLERIKAGEWALGHKLPGETTLAAQLGVGRSTVREAIRELAGRGVLDPRQGAGVFVTAIDATEDWDAVLKRADIASVIEGRIAIETEAAGLAALRRTAADIRAMRRALGRRVVDGQTTEEYVDADMTLHRTVVAAAHNDVLLELFDGFVPRIRRAMIELLRMRPHSRHANGDDQGAHAALVAAIVDHDPATAADKSRSHLAEMKDALT
ncbi:FadR/GntR family transcriptional regulator [Aeromicrobium sp. 9AM]|uniref:FadR/GntR family transcriptional regulator n=1 Tax=Aeromicrobium sp. 9AM TaxID=2653126 RepID=UPI0012F1D52E|nr:FCD domain-containing protein [Aeromicrobium sp. 9AM]VXB08131.1 FadR family transcriptional regulator [Aeromicrobium sp. 9AM]